jgi:hypothetical protein
MDDDRILSRTVVLFNSVYVIESLPDGEPKTGGDLYDSVVFPDSRGLEGVFTKFLSAGTRDDLVRCLAEVGRAARLANHRPIVHIEAHGSDDGIGLADGSTFLWSELIPLFGDINQACRMNLVVVAVSCFGWNLTGALMPSDRAPVNMVIGPVNAMSAGELLNATRKFYRSLFAELDLNKALEAMNLGRPYDEWSIKPGTAEILFCRVFRQYVAELGNPESVRRRSNAIVAQTIGDAQVDPTQVDRLHRKVVAELTDHRQQFDHYRRTFLMLDLFPDDADRFGLSYDLCMPTSGSSLKLR